MNELIKLEVSFEYCPTVYVFRRYKGWYWKFSLPNGEWFVGKAPGKTEKTVKKNALLKEKDLMKGLFRQKELDRFQVTSKKALNFERAVDDYIDHLKAEGASPRYFGTLEKQLKSSGRYIESAFKLRFAHKLTKDDAYNFRRYLLNRVAKGKIVKVSAFRELNDVKRLYKFLKKRGLIMINPFDEIDPIPVPREERARKVSPPVDVLEKLMGADYKHRFEFPIKEFVHGLYRTGARMEELLYMEVQDVDWEMGRWIIKPKECPMRYGMKWKPKYGKPRVSVIPKDVLKLLLPLVERARISRVVGYAPDRYGKPHQDLLNSFLQCLIGA